MAFSNQLSLELELTRLLPLGPLVDKATQTVIDFARSLNHSGSDFIIENDLTEIFGRMRIQSQLASPFKTVIKASASSMPLWADITLQGGPGPTVNRAFQEPAFLSMVIQLSFLTWCYKASSLATAISESLERRQEGAAEPRAVPSREGILSVLESCEKQTSAFNWNLLLNAVTETLGEPIDLRRDHQLHPLILQGALDMLPMVQSLPQDRLVYIHISPHSYYGAAGISPLIVWTHHILGLSVSVKRNRLVDRPEDSPPIVYFGDMNKEQVTIECCESYSQDSNVISLLDSLREDLLTIKPNPTEEYRSISSVRRLPVKAWAADFFDLTRYDIPALERAAVQEELQKISCAFAQLIAKHLVRADYRTSMKFTGLEHDTRRPAYRTDPQRIIEVTSFLFSNAHMTQENIEKYILAYRGKPLNSDLPLPTSVKAALNTYDLELDAEDFWADLCRQALNLSFYVLAFSHILNPDDCESLVFSGAAADDPDNHPLIQQLQNWMGNNPLYIRDDVWLHAMAFLLVGDSQDLADYPWDRICLISDRGWSVWLQIFTHSDVEYIEVGGIVIGSGSPCRRGVWKSGIWDMGHHGLYGGGNMLKAKISLDVSLELRCTENVAFITPMYGEDGDVFMVLSRLKQHLLPEDRIHRFGYRDLHRSLWMSHMTHGCSHQQAHDQPMKLAMDCAIWHELGWPPPKGSEVSRGRIWICPTAKSIGARWLALAFQRNSFGVGDRKILIRSSKCCFHCAIDQAALTSGESLLIL